MADKTYSIIVNAREHAVASKELSFNDVVRLAFGEVSTNPNIVYTVTYRKGEDKKASGTLVAGKTVHLHDGMIIEVDRTDRS